MGYTIDAWIEYDDDDTPKRYPERAGEPPFSEAHDNSISLEHFVSFSHAKDYRLLAALSGIRRRESDPEPLFPPRGGLPLNVSGYTRAAAFKIAEADAFSWLTYPEIKQALAHMSIKRDDLSLATNLVLDLMEAIESRLGEGHSRLIFYIWY